jgi:hypothetical protein
MQGSQLHWTKSSISAGAGACVELAADGEFVAVRHSKHPEVVIRYTRSEFAAFLDGAKGGEFDHLMQPGPA